MRFRRVCTTMRTYLPGVWRHVLNHTIGPDGPLQEDCPIRTGTYSIQNMNSRSITPSNFPVMFYGRWRLDGLVYDGSDACVMCIRLTVNITPKVKQGSVAG
ncbi:uncharacterized protein LOC117653680 [Thrips palmi]|uniref:Uncharacterized protein LOC117653680 n=1 Tax=Thrips palmi TaxID=161013 RepID=A0A6P9ADJ5_THRPL|nr:uncharacterized protein LOC117653680 [Thrips palmi]